MAATTGTQVRDNPNHKIEGGKSELPAALTAEGEVERALSGFFRDRAVVPLAKLSQADHASLVEQLRGPIARLFPETNGKELAIEVAPPFSSSTTAAPAFLGDIHISGSSGQIGSILFDRNGLIKDIERNK